MRIADLLFSFAAPGTFVVDLTAESAGLSNYAHLAPELGLPYQRGAAARDGGQLALIVQNLDRATPLQLDGFDALAPAIVHVVLFERVDSLLEHGVLALAVRHRLELVSTHHTEHRAFRLAAVLRRPDDAGAPARLPLVNELRYDKLRIEDLERARARLGHERDEHTAKVNELAAQMTQLRVEYQQLRVEYQQLSRVADDAHAENAGLREQVTGLQAQLGATFKRLESSRRSLTFRIGRATKAAAATPRKDIITMPRRWIASFRGPDEILEGLRDIAKPGAKPRLRSPVERSGIESGVLLLDLPAPSRAAAGIAGVVSPRFAAELGASTRFRGLLPHSWRALLEAEPPAYVLITADGVAAGAPWASWGTPGGRNGAAVLRDLVEWCRNRHLPTVYWDTLGTGRGVAPGLRFDAVFTVNRHHAGHGHGAAVLLTAAIEPRAWNPIGVDATVPRNPIYAGAFDRRGDGGELARLEALLRAGASRGLEILDSHAGVVGAQAGAVRLPSGLEALARRRPAAAAEQLAIKQAGLLICGNSIAGSETPSWDLLRGLAMGVHVLSTAHEVGDAELVQAVAQAGDQTTAGALLDLLAARPRLDASWRRGFEHLLARYSLRARLDEIARRCGAAAVSEPPPSVAVIARVHSATEVAALRGFLAAQTVAPVEVRVVADPGLEVDARLGEVVERARLFARLPADGPGAGGLIDSVASHLLCWTAHTPAVDDAIAELTRAAVLSDRDVVALAADAGAASYRHGSYPSSAVVAVRRAAAAPLLRGGAPPDEVAAALAGGGAGCLIKVHPGATRPGSQRSVA